ncbi:hypothetical protein [Paenibacillus agilis]|uniref:PQQ-binding-like beta-propeller repeat protein n=1 Tax=Paenibacillus agilis TaxID=3020863 RepID=A0A559IGL5_9BACL|nr:hypothetical protein [Paenibacillus agilis]TVX86815.1 hypothetical protein FPZ44_23135 [Paenibacillus agilis]
MRKLLRRFRTGLTLLLIVIIATFVPVESASASSKGGAGAYTFLRPDGSGKMKPVYYSTAWKFQLSKDWQIENTLVDKKHNMLVVMYSVDNEEYGLASYDFTTGELIWTTSLTGIFEGDYEPSTKELIIQRNGEIFISGVIFEILSKGTNEFGNEFAHIKEVNDALLTIQSSTGKITRKIISPLSNKIYFDGAGPGPWLLSDGSLMTSSLQGFDYIKTILRYYDSKGNLLKTAERHGPLIHFDKNEYVYVVRWDEDNSKSTIGVRDEADKVLWKYTYKHKQGKLKKNEVEKMRRTQFFPDGKFVVFADIYDKTKEKAPRFAQISVFSKHGKLLWTHKAQTPDSMSYKIFGDQLYAFDYKAATLAEVNDGKLTKSVKLAKEPVNEEMTIFTDGTFYTERYVSGWNDKNNKFHYYVGVIKPIRNVLQVIVPDHTRLIWTDSTQVMLINYTNNQISLLRTGQ